MVLHWYSTNLNQPWAISGALGPALDAQGPIFLHLSRYSSSELDASCPSELLGDALAKLPKLPGPEVQLLKPLKIFEVLLLFSDTTDKTQKLTLTLTATGHRSVQGSVVMSWNSETTRSLKRRSLRSRPNPLVDEIKHQMSYIKRCRNSSKSWDWTILYVVRRRLELVSQQKMLGLLKDSMPEVRYQSILRLHSPAFSVGAYRCSVNSAWFQTSSYGSGIVAQDEDLFESSGSWCQLPGIDIDPKCPAQICTIYHFGNGVYPKRRMFFLSPIFMSKSGTGCLMTHCTPV